MPTQDEIFLNEGDNWFKRNKDKMASAVDDEILNYLRSSGCQPQKILDIGCSNGHRLNQLVSIYNAAGYGIEPSQLAVLDGQKQFPKLNLKQGFSHDLGYGDRFFDLVILSFVFHWVDRNKLLSTVSEIDRVLAERGYLIIQDFAPSFVYKTRYHHLPDQEVYTYKQPYWEIFSASQLYSLIFIKEFQHERNGVLDNKNLCKLAVLQKRSDLNYSSL